MGMLGLSAASAHTAALLAASGINISDLLGIRLAPCSVPLFQAASMPPPQQQQQQQQQQLLQHRFFLGTQGLMQVWGCRMRCALGA